MKIGVGFATYLNNDAHFELAKETIESIRSKHDLKLEFAINKISSATYMEYLEDVGTVTVNDDNIVSMGWNRVIRDLLDVGCKYVIVPNLDVVFNIDTVDNLVAFAEAHPDFILWTATQWPDRDIESAEIEDTFHPHPHFSAFMVDHRLLEQVGPFDENFRPAYNEDLDMHWRIRLAGYEAMATNTAKFFHHGSQTILHDEALRVQNNLTHYANDQYFVHKWGYKPPTANDEFTAEMYRFPFNDPERGFTPKE